MLFDSDYRVADSKFKISQELQKIKDRFMSLLIDIQDRLSRRVSIERMVDFAVMYAHQFKGQRKSQQLAIAKEDFKLTDNASSTEDAVMYAHQFKGQRKSQQLAIAKEDLKLIDNASSTDDVFRVLSKYWSFLDHKMLDCLVRCLGGRRIRWKVKEYRKQLKKFFEKRKMLEFKLPLRCFDNTCITELNETHERIIVKLDLNDPSWDDIVHLKESICTILEILPSALLICKVEDGCIKVTFYIPKLIAQEIFEESLKVEQCKALTSTPIMTLSMMRENVIFTVSDIIVWITSS